MEQLGLGVELPTAEEWRASGEGAIVVSAAGDVIGLEHRWPEPCEAENDSPRAS
jgi:hypothetical protein